MSDAFQDRLLSQSHERIMVHFHQFVERDWEYVHHFVLPEELQDIHETNYEPFLFVWLWHLHPTVDPTMQLFLQWLVNSALVPATFTIHTLHATLERIHRW